MFDIWASLDELRQPCLRRGISDRMLGADKLVSSEILKSLDRLFLEHLEVGRASFQAPPMPAPIPAVERFLNISALQKSIRRGDAQGAMKYAMQGFLLNPEQVFRRLATCAVEDVGIGNLLAVGMALAVIGIKSVRQNGAAGELAAFLAHVLAISPKSRLACDLLSIADFERELTPMKLRLAKADASTLRQLAGDRTKVTSHRMVAAWLLAGTARFSGATMPSVSRSRTDFMALMASSRMPLILYYIADRAAARLGDAMFVSQLFIAEIVGRQPEMYISASKVQSSACIAGYPACAFDLHTNHGRMALRQFALTDKPLVHLLSSLSPFMRELAVRHGVFIAEGGVLANRLECDEALRIERLAHSSELSFAGLCSFDAQSSLLKLIGDAYCRINVFRHSVFGSNSGEP